VGAIAGEAGIERARLWTVMKRFFATVADVLREDNPAFAEKLPGPARTGCGIPTRAMPCMAALS
jgi:hypothetical protein